MKSQYKKTMLDDILSSSHIQLDDRCEGKTVSDEIKKTTEGLFSAICFDVGDVSEKYRMCREKNEVPFSENLPFNNMFMSGNYSMATKGEGEQIKAVKNNKVGIHITKDKNELLMVVYIKHGDSGHVQLFGYAVVLLKESSRGEVYFHLYAADGKKVEDVPRVQLFTFLVSAVFVVLDLLHCTNIIQVENKPPQKLSASRVKKGKPPLVSYWTLHIDNSRKSPGTKIYGGGTHTSPRVHLRRGHVRQYAPGKFTWVQPCVVGNGDGIIHKNYSVDVSPQPVTP